MGPGRMIVGAALGAQRSYGQGDDIRSVATRSRGASRGIGRRQAMGSEQHRAALPWRRRRCARPLLRTADPRAGQLGRREQLGVGERRQPTPIAQRADHDLLLRSRGPRSRSLAEPRSRNAGPANNRRSPSRHRRALIQSRSVGPRSRGASPGTRRATKIGRKRTSNRYLSRRRARRARTMFRTADEQRGELGRRHQLGVGERRQPLPRLPRRQSHDRLLRRPNAGEDFLAERDRKLRPERSANAGAADQSARDLPKRAPGSRRSECGGRRIGPARTSTVSVEAARATTNRPVSVSCAKT